MKATFRHDLHVEMWNWIFNNPDKEKSDWPRWKKLGGDVRGNAYDCFACVYNEFNDRGSCAKCPLIWPSGDCIFHDGLFQSWNSSEDPEERRVYAKQIRDLAIRSGVKIIRVKNIAERNEERKTIIDLSKEMPVGHMFYRYFEKETWDRWFDLFTHP
jgi:hypothetical protein